MSQVTVASECERLSLAELREWVSEIEAEALDVWSNAEMGRLRRQREQVLAEIARRESVRAELGERP